MAAALLGVGAGELTATLVAPEASPFAVIGSALIDLAPSWAKETAIALFGTNDKIALLVGIGIALVGLAALAGLVELRWPPSGLAVMVVFGGVGALAAVTRANAGPLDWVPSVVAGVMAAVALGVLMARRPGRVRVAPIPQPDRVTIPRAKPPAEGAEAEEGVQRRTFLLWVAGTAAVGILATVGSSLRAPACTRSKWSGTH